MEWFWVAMSALWTWIAAAASLWLWRAPARWDAQGYIDNGLGTIIRKADRPNNFRGLLFATKAFSVWIALFAIFGFGATVARIWMALT
jgi:hypothetical protein